MRTETQIKIGLITSVVIIALLILSFFAVLVRVIYEGHPLFFFVILFLYYAIAINAPAFYVSAIIKRQLKFAKWMYRICSAGIIYFWVNTVFAGLFTMTSSEGLMQDTIILILIAVFFSSLLIIPFKVGINGLARKIEIEKNRTE